MSSQRLRVFVSSRMQELRREREAIRAALADMRVDTFVFEIDAGARPVSVQQTYLEEEEEADLYVGIFWKGYGAHSIVEFEQACSLGMDCLIYERPEDATGGRDRSLQAFLDRIGGADSGLVTIGRFQTIEDLTESIKNDVARWQARLAREAKDIQSAIFHGVPSRPPADFVGRGAEIARMVRALRSGQGLAIEGLPGIGKTTVATALAHHPSVRRYFNDGVLWASLGPKADAASAIMRWAQALASSTGRTKGSVEVTPDEVARLPDLADRTQKLRDAIGHRRMLLVIDDAWDSDAADALRCGGPRCGHLMTTRDRQIAQAFAGSASIERLHDLDEREACQLVQRLAPEAYGANPAGVRGLVRAVGGLPQAVRLVGGYLARPDAGMFGDMFAGLSTKAFEDMANPQKRLQLAERRLGSRAAGKTSIQATISLSLRGLPKRAQRAFYRLGAFAATPERFTPDAAAAVAEADGTTLALLAARNLLDVDTVTRRLSIHPTLADVARTKLDRSGAGRHREHYLDVLKQMSGDPRQIEDIYGQLRWAWHQCPDDETLFPLLEALQSFQKRRGLFSETLAWAERARAVAEARNLTPAVAGFLGMIADAEGQLGRFDQALAHYRQTLALWDAVGQPLSQINSHICVALSLGRVGRHDEALAETEKAGALAAATGDGPKQQALMRFATAVLLRQAKAPAKALEAAQRAHVLFRELGEKSDEAASLMFLGTIHRDLGEHESALECLRASIALKTELGDDGGHAEARLVMASVSDARGQLEEALATAHDACAKADASGSRHVFAQGLGIVGDLLLKLGRFDQALTNYKQQLAVYEEVDNRGGRVDALTNIATAHLQQRRPTEASRAGEDALRICEDLGDRARRANTLELLAFAHHRLEGPRQAVAYLREALTIWQDLGHRPAGLLGDLGALYTDLEQHEKALQAYSQADALVSTAPSQGEPCPAEEPPRAARRARDAARFGPRAIERGALVPPLMLGIGRALTSWLDDGHLRQTLLEVINVRRGAVQKSMGVLPPRVLIAENRRDVARDAYRIVVDGVPVVSVALQQDAGIDDIAEHLHSVMRTHLYHFMGHQQTLEMVERIAPERAGAMRGEPAALSRLVHLLRNLLEEGVPLVAFDDILQAFFDSYATHTRLAALQALRLLPKVRAQLPGNVGQGSCLRLAEEAEEEISQSIQVDDSGSFLSMPPERIQHVLTMVRRTVEARADIVSVVVIKPGIRRFVRKAIELEFPALPVLSYDELLPERTGSICDVLPSHSA